MWQELLSSSFFIFLFRLSAMFASLQAILLLSIAIQCASALPTNVQHKRRATHAIRTLPGGPRLQTYHPKSHFEVYQRGLKRRGLQSDSSNLRSAGLQFVHSKFNGANEEDLHVVSEYKAAHGTHVYIGQKYAGIPIANTLSNVALSKSGDVLSYSSSLIDFRSSSSFAAAGGYKTTPKLTTDEASSFAVQALGGRADSQLKPSLQFFAIDDGSLKLTHAIRVNLADGHLVDAFVDTEDGSLRGVMDYTFELSMRIVPITKRSPLEAHELLEDVEDMQSSTRGWNFAAKQIWNSTIGNNAVVGQINLETLGGFKDAVPSTSPMSADGVFDYAFDPSKGPTEGGNTHASNVNAFYVVNTAHDILYRYGFTETAFNFQYQAADLSMEPGPDMVLTSVQDMSDHNNAQFSSAPDGVPGMLRLWTFDYATPNRDSALANDIILHEYAHGLTNRMTGGGTAKCLQTDESRGLGEGWSDAFANWVWQTGRDSIGDFATGAWVIGDVPEGIRSHPYSVDSAVNPLKYSDLLQRTEVHDIGEVWAQALHVVMARLVDKFGFAADALTNSDGDNGLAVFMRLYVDALAVQPCNPSFLDARLAWIQADENRYAGKHKCVLWQAFASVGLGEGAAAIPTATRCQLTRVR
ncbi:Fungalysin metallopeptidase-domain-containing protein [Auriculariales sp. MPI-PUGE-AT-0066]|nr:Fungalysin metallopeptidase-domain-containing protein [Auriculariales sp. MPI-PUGE-AT-0066]